MGTGVRIATASVRTDLAMTGFPWSVVHGRRATARVAPTEGYKECLAGGQGRPPLRICGNACVGRGYKRCGKTGRRGRRPLRMGY